MGSVKELGVIPFHSKDFEEFTTHYQGCTMLSVLLPTVQKRGQRHFLLCPIALHAHTDSHTQSYCMNIVEHTVVRGSGEKKDRVHEIGTR